MKNIRLSRLFLILAFVFLLAGYALLMVLYVRTLGKLEGADFMTYYSVGRVGREYGLNRVYDLDLEAAAQAATAGVPTGTRQVLPPNHPPFLYPYLALLAGLDYRAAYFGYLGLLALLVLAGLPALFKAIRKSGWPPSAAWLALAGVLLFEPFFFSLLKGQDTALLLLGGLLWFSGFLLEEDRMAGLGLALTLIRPQIALLLAIPFLFRRRRVFAWFCAGAAALGIYSFLLVGPAGVKDYLHILTLSAGGEGYGMAEAAMFNLTGLLLRLFPGAGLPAVHAIGWGAFAVALIGLCLAWAFAKKLQVWHFVLAASLALLAVPHLHYHDLALLVVPLLGLGLVAVRAGRLKVGVAAALPVILSVLLLAGEWVDPIHFTVPYLLMAGLPALTWWLERGNDR